MNALKPQPSTDWGIGIARQKDLAKSLVSLAMRQAAGDSGDIDDRRADLSKRVLSQ